MQKEIWKDIPYYEGMYQVSNFGRVKSLSRKIKCKNGYRLKKESILKLNLKKTGYFNVQLLSKGKTHLVHRLVAEAFLPNFENKPQVNHINGVKNDNRVENLEWCTQSENQIHAYKHKLQLPSKHRRASGENSGNAKLDLFDVDFIRKNYKRGDAPILALMFKVSSVTILNIVNYKTWYNERECLSKKDHRKV